MRLLLTSLLLATVLCAGCSSLDTRLHSAALSGMECTEKESDEARLYQLYINSNGDLLDPALTNKVVDEGLYISNILKNFERKNRKKKEKQKPALQLTIFVHGGLNTFENATERVNKIKCKMLDDGKYPLFISWDSGFPGNYSDHLFLLRRGIKSPILGPLSSPFVLLEDVARSVTRLPASTYNVLFGQNSNRIKFTSKEERAAEKSLDQLSPKFKIYICPNDKVHGFRDYWSFLNPLKLVTAPFVDQLGSGAWNSMLRRTDLVLRKQAAFDGDAGVAPAGTATAGAPTAASEFLRRWQHDYPDHEVTLIGHSMGTIIANNIVAKYQDIKFSRIVYMAAACTTKDLEYVIAPFLERNPEAEFYNLTLNAYSDILENCCVDALPRGSLLVWIDQTLANVNSFQDRTAGYWFNIVRSANQVFANQCIRERVHLTQFGIKDDSPEKHGDFGDYPFWREEFWRGDLCAAICFSQGVWKPLPGFSLCNNGNCDRRIQPGANGRVSSTRCERIPRQEKEGTNLCLQGR